MDNLKPTRLSTLRTHVSFLLKDVKNNSPDAGHTAKRFLQIPFFRNKTIDWILGHLETVQLKHAYQVIAIENGFLSWAALKQYVTEKDCLYCPAGIAYIHAWFNDYPKAAAYHQLHGGYLLAFWKDFVVCGKEYIRSLQLDSYGEYWKQIGYNWVQPQQEKAFSILKEKAIKNYLQNN
jgi:hypothetical protein